jgi:uncharacterized membrane protein
MQALTTTVARVLFALPFGIFGLLHFMGGQNMAGMVPAWIPGGVFWVYLTGLAHIAATVSIIAQKKARLASLLFFKRRCSCWRRFGIRRTGKRLIFYNMARSLMLDA